MITSDLSFVKDQLERGEVVGIPTETVYGLAAPSANPYNRISPTCAVHVEDYFPQIPILEGGNCEAGVESTILSFEGDEVVLLRHGAISMEQIE